MVLVLRSRERISEADKVLEVERECEEAVGTSGVFSREEEEERPKSFELASIERRLARTDCNARRATRSAVKEEISRLTEWDIAMNETPKVRRNEHTIRGIDQEAIIKKKGQPSESIATRSCLRELMITS